MTTTSDTSTPQGVTRWRKMPADPEVQAVQLLDDARDWGGISAWCGGTVGQDAAGDSGEYDAFIEIPGGGRAFEGAWIVKGDGGFRICEDFVFSEVYEPATSPGTAGDQVTVSAADLATVLGEAEGFIGGKDNPAFSRLAAAAGVE